MCNSPEISEHALIQLVKARLLADLTNPPSLEDLADETSLSPFQLSRLFGRTIGKTIPGVLREKRMEVAAELLRQGDARIGEVAVKVGYSSLSAFNRAFTREIGIAPLKYRQNIRT
jgi:AraC-like DNA-binding protein